jgi:hypothetical protein
MSTNNTMSGGGSPTMAASDMTAPTEVQRSETHDLIASDKVEGTDVCRPDGEKIGAIDRLMIDKRSGHVTYAVMSFGGFLGLGESRRPIPWDKLHYNTDLDAYELAVTDDQLRAAPEYRDDDGFDWSDPSWNSSMRSHYGARDRMAAAEMGGPSFGGAGADRPDHGSPRGSSGL